MPKTQNVSQPTWLLRNTALDLQSLTWIYSPAFLNRRVVEDFQTGRGLTFSYFEFTQISQKILNCGSWNFFFKNTGRGAIWVEKHLFRLTKRDNYFRVSLDYFYIDHII